MTLTNAWYSAVPGVQGTRTVTVSPCDVPAHPAPAAHKLSASRQRAARIIALLMRTRTGTRRAWDGTPDVPARPPAGTGAAHRPARRDTRPTGRKIAAVRHSG